MLRLVVIGIEPMFVPLLQWAKEHGRGEVVALFDTGESTDAILQLFPRAQLWNSWETLLDVAPTDQKFDAVLLGRAGSERIMADDAEQEERLHKLAPTGLPIFAAHPALDSMLTAYELELFVRDGQAKLAPLLPLRTHPLVKKFTETIYSPQTFPESSPLGGIEYALITRTNTNHSRKHVMNLFAQDVDLLRLLLGEVKSVLAMGGDRALLSAALSSMPAPNVSSSDASTIATNNADQISSLNVQLIGTNGCTARWSVEPLASNNTGTLNLFGTLHSARWELPSMMQSGHFEFIAANSTTTKHETETPLASAWQKAGQSSWSFAEVAWQQLEHLVQNKPTEPTWHDAARALELTEAMQRSLLRGRQVDVRVEEAGELSNFKGVMTSLGCGLIFVVLGVILGGNALSYVLNQIGYPELARIVNQAWPYLLLALLILFLLVQVVVKYFVAPLTGHDSTKSER